jgi:hypothetical protein
MKEISLHAPAWREGRSTNSLFPLGEEKKVTKFIPLDFCHPDAARAWQDWKMCTRKHLDKSHLGSSRKAGIQENLARPSNGSVRSLSPEVSMGTTTSDEFMIENRANLPRAMQSNFTAVLVEFWPLKQALVFY